MRFYETIQYIIIVVGLYDFKYPVVLCSFPNVTGSCFPETPRIPGPPVTGVCETQTLIGIVELWFQNSV